MAIKTVHAGHGGRKVNGRWTDSGAVGSGYQEADVARTITAKMAKKAGVKDVTDNSATTSNNIIYAQQRSINANGDGYHISNHLNAATPAATGVEVLYGSVSEKPLAAKVSAAIAKALGLVDRGPKDGTWLGIATGTGSGKKVLLIEWGFITNSNDMKKLMANMDKGIDAALKALGVSVAPTEPSKPTEPAKPSTGGSFKVGDEVKVVDALYADSEGKGRSTASRGKTGTIKRDVGKGKRYLIDSLGWAHANDIEKVSSTSIQSHKKGDTVTVSKNATHYQTGQAIASFVKGQKYRVKDIKVVSQSRSKKAYLLEGINSWLLEQDVY